MLLRKLPNILASLFFLVLLLAGILTVVRPVLSEALDWMYRDRVPALVGIEMAHEPPTLSVQTLFDHSFQNASEWWVSAHLPQRALIVRSFNQALWRMFGSSYMASGGIVRGVGGVLFEKSYILAHCGILPATNIPALPRFAARLSAAQKWFASRGQLLIYMLGEAKTSWFSDRIPSEFPCPTNRLDPGYVPAREALTAAGVDFVDGRKVLEAARQDVGINLFPRNGLHWNWLGAALASEALIRQLRALGAGGLPDLSYNVTVEPDELMHSYDRDLADLLNLLYPLQGAPSPQLQVHAWDKPACTLAAVSDSFFSQPADLLQKGGIFRRIEINRYLTLGRQILPDPQEHPINVTAPDAYASLLTADVIVLEEVETRIGGPYALMFLDIVEQQMVRAPTEQRAASPGCMTVQG
jgi:hypothetical protein